MKAVALILAMFVSLLTVKPGLDAMNTQFSSTHTSSCCAVSCNPIAESGQSSEDGGCSGKSCNVFGACTSCVLQITEASELSVDHSIEVVSLSPALYESTFSSRYIADCWHPPRFV